MKGKKGIQLGQAFGAVLAIVLVATLVIVAIYLFTTLGSTFAGSSTGTITNESGSINATGYTLTNSTLCQYAGLSITGITNASTGANIPSGNWTLNTTTSTLINATANQYPSVKISYTYTWGGPACTATQTMTSQFGNYPTLVGLVGTIIFLALVIGVLVASFIFGRKGV